MALDARIVGIFNRQANEEMRSLAVFYDIGVSIVFTLLKAF